jgi:hypothetical protein
VRAAEWSEKSTVKNHQNILFIAKISKGNAFAGEVGHGKIRSGRV